MISLRDFLRRSFCRLCFSWPYGDPLLFLLKLNWAAHDAPLPGLRYTGYNPILRMGAPSRLEVGLASLIPGWDGKDLIRALPNGLA
jgi:hypothetical protein